MRERICDVQDSLRTKQADVSIEIRAPTPVAIAHPPKVSPSSAPSRHPLAHSPLTPGPLPTYGGLARQNANTASTPSPASTNSISR